MHVEQQRVTSLTEGQTAWQGNGAPGESNPADGLSRGGLANPCTLSKGWHLSEASQPDWIGMRREPQQVWGRLRQTLGTAP